MVDTPLSPPTASKTRPFRLEIIVCTPKSQAIDTLLAALQPEFKAIDSKRVKLQVTPTRNQLEIHLAAKDVKALRAAATSLLRLYTVADGVLHLAECNSGEDNG